MQTPSDTQSAQAGAPTSTDRDSKPRILVVDDSRLVRVSIKKVLGEEFDLVEAGDGEEGWEKLVSDPLIQVVLTDAGMPKLDGEGLIKRIRSGQNEQVKNIPVMMITGAEADQLDAREHALEIGATDFVTKPFDKAQLLARVRGYTKLDQTQRSLENTAEALAQQSVIDELTGVYNRRYFLERGEKDLAYAKRHHEDISIIVIGIDSFDNNKSEYGDDIANKLLVWSAKQIKDMMRKEDTISRITDSHFAICASSASRMAAAVLCERIRKQFIKTPFSKSGISINVTVSMGLTCHGREDSTSIEALLEAAEQRSRQAFQQGGNRTVASSDHGEQKKPEARMPSIDAALTAIKQNKVDQLNPVLLLLARQVIPVLELCNRKLNWDLDMHINAIKAKIEKN